MEFIDFLKYGAIGISLALAILSYRLLSKEQDKTEVSMPILSLIKLYFLLTVFLSVLFSATEIVTIILNKQDSKSNEPIEKIWTSFFRESPDSTIIQKMNRISDHIYAKENEVEEINNEYENCRKELDQFDKGFYQNVIKLKNVIKNDPDEWTNIDYETEKKEETIVLLKEIFRSLGENYDDLNDKQLVKKWISFKKGYTSNRKKYTLIENSDITQIVRKYLDLHADE